MVLGEEVRVSVTGVSIEPVAEAREAGRLEPAGVACSVGPAPLLTTVQPQEAAVTQCP